MIYFCTHCDAQFPKWSGRCTECGKWGTVSSSAPDDDVALEVSVQAFTDPQLEHTQRILTGMSEVDRVLGGGIVAGALVLLGGEPGIGKSTLLLQIALKISVQNVLYASGEESFEQVRLRMQRIGHAESKKVQFFGTNNLERILAAGKKTRPQLLIIDSIQTLASEEAEGGAGSIAQLRVCSVKLLAFAKETTTSVVVAGHVTKEGTIAGPKMIEHLVDVVLYVEGDRHHFYRLLRSVKNRFGSIDEIGIFEMKEKGLVEVQNPSALFLPHDPSHTHNPGSCVSVIMEGVRSLLIEVQALTAKTVFGYPKRTASGYDVNRLQLLLAVLSRHANMNLSAHDVYVNIAGGLKIKETSVDAAVLSAVASSFLNKPVHAKTVVIGEVGLSGRVSPVSRMDARLSEAQKLGFTAAVIPHGTAFTKRDMEMIDVSQVRELMTKVLRDGYKTFSL